jgi:primosomal protein N' (replication factor Y)
LFPHARTLRWDAESTRQRGAHEVILGHFIAHRADVLVGTQMLAKGLDLPLVTLVGVVLADVGLNLPDFRAAERTFQVLTQVAGRAGRSPLGGQVILQTFQPDHYAIQAAAQHNEPAFFERELAERRKLGYPPFSSLVRLEYRHADPGQAEAAARSLAGRLENLMQSAGRRATQMIGPAPCFFEKVNGLYRWQIVLRGPDPVSLLRSAEIRTQAKDGASGKPLNRWLGDWRIEVNPPNLL